MWTEFWIFELSESKRKWNKGGYNLFLYTLFWHQNQQKLTSGELFLFLNNGSVSEYCHFVLFEIDIIYFARCVYHISKVVVNIMYLALIHENSFSHCGIGENYRGKLIYLEVKLSWIFIREIWSLQFLKCYFVILHYWNMIHFFNLFFLYYTFAIFHFFIILFLFSFCFYFVFILLIFIS